MLGALRKVLWSGQAGSPLHDLAVLGFRLIFALTMAMNHGRGTLAGFPEHAAEYPDPLGLGGHVSMALMVFAEFFCALAVAAGFLTRLALIPLVFGMSVAFFLFHAADPFSRKELAFLYLSAFTLLALTGPGRFSLDYLIFSKRATQKDSVEGGNQ
ncbi:MAG: DoxX family protein [Acidobacteria bacterium]|nr:DoxX family protein [Acidobacteriota bacterium]